MKPPIASASASAAAVPFVSRRTLLYREFFTGMRPNRAKLRTWTLSLGAGGRFILSDESAIAGINSLVKETPLANVEVVERVDYAGTWTSAQDGSIKLVFNNGEGEPIRCSPGSVDALEPGAALVLTPIPYRNMNHVRWAPSKRSRVPVLKCERSWVASTDYLWSEEPQPKRIPFADLPGVEYAHDNSDMVVQYGGLRRLRPPVRQHSANSPPGG